MLSLCLWATPGDYVNSHNLLFTRHAANEYVKMARLIPNMMDISVLIETYLIQVWLWQKHYTQVWPDWGMNPSPPDYKQYISCPWDTVVLTNRPSETIIEMYCHRIYSAKVIKLCYDWNLLYILYFESHAKFKCNSTKRNCYQLILGVICSSHDALLDHIRIAGQNWQHARINAGLAAI